MTRMRMKMLKGFKQWGGWPVCVGCSSFSGLWPRRLSFWLSRVHRGQKLGVSCSWSHSSWLRRWWCFLGGEEGRARHSTTPRSNLSWTRSKHDLKPLTKKFYFCARAFHSLVIFWLVLDLWPDTDSVIQHYLLPFNHSSWSQTMAGKLYVSVGKLIVISVLFFFIFTTLEPHEIISIILPWLCFCIALILQKKTPVSMTLNRMLVVDVGYFFGLFLAPIILFFMLDNICSKYPSVGEHFSGRKINTESVNTVDRGEGVLIFVSFLYTVVLCVCWYAFRYNPAGTVNPGWTRVFGWWIKSSLWSGWKDFLDIKLETRLASIKSANIGGGRVYICLLFSCGVYYIWTVTRCIDICWILWFHQRNSVQLQLKESSFNDHGIRSGAFLKDTLTQTPQNRLNSSGIFEIAASQSTSYLFKFKYFIIPGKLYRQRW